MHLFDAAKRFYGGNAIVGGGLPVAVGLALADKMQGKHRVTCCFFGEGAVAEGEFHESMKLAALWQLPVLFVCENNLYAMGTALKLSESVTDLTQKAAGYTTATAAVGRARHAWHSPGADGHPGRRPPRHRRPPGGAVLGRAQPLSPGARKTMTEAQIKETILKGLGTIAPEADLGTLNPNANVRETLDIDSFDFLNFLIGLNDALGVEIPEADYGQLATLADIVAYLRARVR